MKLIITTPEILESLIDSSVSKAVNDFYFKKEFEMSRNKNYTIKEASLELRVSVLTIRNYIDKGYLKANKIGNRVLINNDCIEKALKEVKNLRYKR
jgi:excisionase family DNA binding protein